MTVDLSKIGYGSVFAADSDGIQLSKISYGSIFNHSPTDGLILSKVGFGVIVNEGVTALWPETVPDDSEVYPVDHVTKIVAPDFVDDGGLVYLPSFEFQFIIPDRERNPFPAHIPFKPDVSQLADFHAEQQRIIRQQHNKTQAGDTTFDYGLLLKAYPNQEYTLGSMGRFYHPDYGLLIGRYVQFTQMVNTAVQGVPVGRLLNGTDQVDWVVTNDFTKSGRDLVGGIIFIPDAPADGTFGWMLTHGPTPTPARAGTDTIPVQNEPYSWTGTGFLSLGARGRILARRWGKAFTDKLSSGSLFVDLEGLSPADLTYEIGQATAGLVSDVSALDGRVTTNTTNIGGLRTDVTALQTGQASLQSQIKLETRARIRDVASIRDALGSAVDWSSAIVSGDNLVRAEFAAADSVIRTIAVNAQTVANNAWAVISGADLVGMASSLSLLTGGVNAIQIRLMDFAVDTSVPATANQVLLYDSIGLIWKPGNAVLSLVAGTGILVDATDPQNPIAAIDTIAEAERIRDIIGAALVAGNKITITVNDPADTITVAVTGLNSNYRVPANFSAIPSASQVLVLHTFAESVTFPANWTGSQGTIGTNPTASFVVTISKNGSTVGTITVSTGGAFTFATSGGTAVTFAAGDVLKAVAPGVADATAANFAATLLGAY